MGSVRLEISDTLHKKLKLLSVEREIPLQELMVIALQKYLERN